MITAYHSTVLDHPVDRVWSLIRDFNNYPAYIDGVTASVIEDSKRGDEIGAVRRFKYGDNWIRQRLSDHSDAWRTLSYVGIELFAFPAGRMADPPTPVRYEGTIHLLPIVDDDRTFIEWPVTLHTTPGEEEPWQELFLSWIPEWTESLRRALARQ
ncbi:MAG: SRPBCC family protein [Xanthobacteraceae bacterium]